MNMYEAWRCFNLADNNQDPGGSWLYAIRYSEENLRDHQDVVITALQGMGITMNELSEGELYLDTDWELSEEEVQKALILAEELTVTNEALESARLKLFGTSVVQLANMYKFAFLSSISRGDKPRAAGLLRVEMPQVVSDLSRAQEDNEPLSESDYKAVVDLGDFIANKTAMLLSGEDIVVISNVGPAQSLSREELPDNY